MNVQEPLSQLFSRSQLLTLDFDQIPAGTPDDENIALFFASYAARGKDPRSPKYRQAFNNHVLHKNNMRYLIGRYGEDRRAMLSGSSIAKEKRTIHLGIDCFCKKTETVYAPCDGRIEQIGREPGSHSFGNYIIFRPAMIPNIFFLFGHLSGRLPTEKSAISEGQPIAQLGDYANDENGGWSVHLHIQVLTELPAANQPLIGYCTKKDFAVYRHRFPDPSHFFQDILPGNYTC